jgi:hypothetical protein
LTHGAALTKTCMTKIRLAGVVQAKDVSPYVYFIKRGYLLYIGETQKNPVHRWSEHLSERGSFRNAVLRVDEEILTRNLLTSFYAYRCVMIEESVSEVKRKRATQYVEDKLHNRVMCRGIPSESEIKVISRTDKTAPLGYGYDWLDEYVDSIYETFVVDLVNRRFAEA